jgi:hypothetical protein
LRSISGPRAEIFAVKAEKVDRKKTSAACVAAGRSELDDVERGDAVRANAAQFAIQIALPRIEHNHGFGDRRIFVDPVEPGAR